MLLRFSTFFFLFLSTSLFGQDGLTSLWTNTIGGEGNESIKGVVTDSLGNIYSTGSFEETVDFDPDTNDLFLTSLGGTDMFIQKSDPDGNLLWVETIVGVNNVSGKFIDIDHNGDLIISAYFGGSIMNDAFPDSIITSNIETSVAVFKYDTSGEFIWAYSSSGEIATVYSMAIDQLGNTLVAGAYKHGDVDFNDGPGGVLSTSGSGAWEDDGFILKIDSDGDYVWVDGIGGDHTDRNFGVITDLQNNVYVCGTFSYTAYFGPYNEASLNSPGAFESYVMKYNSSGQFVWLRASEGGNNSYAYAITIDDNSDLYIAGGYSGTTDFDPSTEEYLMSAGGYTDAFIQKLSSDGDFIWSKSIGGPNESSNNYGKFIDTDPSHYIYVTGVFQDTVDFDPSAADYTLTSIGGHDVFTQKLDSDGNFIWARSFGGFQNDGPGKTYLDRQYNLYLIGGFRDTCSLDINTTAFTDTSNGLVDGYMMKIDQDSCATFTTLTDSISILDCVSSGYVSVSAFNGLEPYLYEWNINSTDTSAIIVDEGGIISVTISDVNSCTKTTSYVFNDPPPTNSFDLDANLITSEFRPGFISDVTIDAFNYGCIPSSGEVIIILDSLVSLDSAYISPQVIGDSLIWNLPSMDFNSDHFIVNLDLDVSVLASIEDTVCFDLIINPILGDADTTNNTKHYCYPIVNGYDPNDKQVFPLGICEEHYVLNTEDLTYTIQFQNTGNSEAINVHIIDTLSSLLDINTVTILTSSHDLITEVKPGNVLDFKFDAIHLIDSASGGELSKGYVIFKVTPISIVPDGSIVSNKCEIYFDFNPAVITNTVFNTLLSELFDCSTNLSADEVAFEGGLITIYPNPNNGSFTLDFSKEKKASINVYTINGQLIYQEEGIFSKRHPIEIEGAPGVYLLEIVFENDREFYKIMKE